MILLGIDHATTSNLGFGVVEYDKDNKPKYVTHEIFRLDVPYPVSLRYGSEKVREVIIRCKPDIVVMEDQKSNRGFNTTKKLHEIQGCIKLVCLKLYKPYIAIPPMTMKKLVTGNGWASKEEVGRTVAIVLGISYEEIIQRVMYKIGIKRGTTKKVNWDASDALGLTIAYNSFIKGRKLDYERG